MALVQQVKVGKLHLIAPGRKVDGQVEYRTCCGIRLSWQHMAQPAMTIWVGPDKCRKCLGALDRGDFGAIESSRNP